MRISLISMPGGGKSTVGRQLAKLLGDDADKTGEKPAGDKPAEEKKPAELKPEKAKPIEKIGREEAELDKAR